MIKTFKKLKDAGGWGYVAFAAALTICAGMKPPSPPTLVEKGIKLTTFSAPLTGGMNIGWKVEDDRIKLGEDEFIIEFQERQIPARTGWSAWRELGRTKNVEFYTDGFWRNRDIRLKIIVDKGALLK
jgi:hypothetical protein